MKREEITNDYLCTRRRFVRGSVAAISASLFSTALAPRAEAEPNEATNPNLAFTAAENEYRFDTGAVQGALRSGGRSRGLLPMVDCASGANIARGAGLFSHYRLLDAGTRYGPAGWDWTSRAKILQGGEVEVVWMADEEHPFDMKALYRWAAPNILDLTTSVVPKKSVQRFEVFLASYFEGFPASFAYVKGCPETGGKAGFLEAKKAYAAWQMFPRDDEAVKTINDGRWQRPPNPVTWKMMPSLAAPLAMRRDVTSGLTGLVMAPPEDCFAVATPYSEESHRSLYLSLLGGDLEAGQVGTARARLILGREISDERAVALYKAYINAKGAER